MYRSISRRSFIGVSLKTCAFLSLPSLLSLSPLKSTKRSYSETQLGEIPPLFCLAYIDPALAAHQNQETTIAKFPLAIVPQDNRQHFVDWKNRIKALNPSIIFLAYQMVNSEISAPGPGNLEVAKAANPWCVYPGGYVPRLVNNGRARKLIDPRNKEWQNRFLDGCRKVLASYPYQGLFLDNCTVILKTHPLPSVRQQMRDALQEVLLNLRKEFPLALIVGNCRDSWAGLNGEMNEGRPDDLEKESAPFAAHALPRLEMYQTYLKAATDTADVQSGLALARQKNCFYGACVTAQQVLWFNEFETLSNQYKSII